MNNATTNSATTPATATSTANAAADESRTPTRLAVVIGSDREGRFAPTLADWLLAQLHPRQDLEVDVVDLAEIDLPTALSSSPDDRLRGELAKVSPKLAAADAFLILTPEYNHSFPAALKSLIDWHFTQWQAKPVGFVSYGGISGGLRAVEQLRQIFAELHAVTIRDTVSFHNVWGLFDGEGAHKDPTAAEGATKKMVDQLTWWALALREAKTVRPYAS